MQAHKQTRNADAGPSVTLPDRAPKSTATLMTAASLPRFPPRRAFSLHRLPPNSRTDITALPHRRIEVYDAQNGAVVSQIQAKSVLDMYLSPSGSQIQTWERQGM